MTIEARKRGGRPATGHLKYFGNRWHVRVTLADGTRSPWIDLDPNIPEDDRARARSCALVLSNEARDGGDVRAAVQETVAEYAKRWLEDREERGIGTVASHDRGRLGKHVFPKLGALDVRTFGREDVERLVEDLDRKISLSASHEGHLSWKTASNVWVLVSKMCKDMADAKHRELRVREDNPAARVAPPERGDARAKNYLYPSEFRRLVECTAIDVTFRTLYTAAVYTYARAGEMDALTWEDVDLEHGVIHITKAVDRETGKVKSTKSGTTRRIPIDDELRPLLDRLYAEAKGNSPMPPTGARALDAGQRGPGRPPPSAPARG